MVKFIFGNLPKLLIYIWDEKYIENIFEFNLILAYDLKTKNRKGIRKMKELKKLFLENLPKIGSFMFELKSVF